MKKLSNMQIAVESKVLELSKKYNLEIINKHYISNEEMQFVRIEFLHYLIDIFDDTLNLYNRDLNEKDGICLEIWDYKSDEDMSNDFIKKTDEFLSNLG